MLKSPEEYLTSLVFDAEDQRGRPLDAVEKAFVEKYMGMDALEKMPVQDPEPVLLPAPELEIPRPVLLKEPRIVVSPPEPRISAPDIIAVSPPKITEVSRSEQTIVAEPSAVIDKQAVADAIEAPIEISDKAESVQITDAATDLAQPVESKETITVEESINAVTTTEQAAIATTPDITAHTASGIREAEIINADQEISLREKLRNVDEIQTVSFFVASQLFLLPVMGIQEVVRYIDLVKVPQAPSFIAGAINLRGRVLPLVHLSELLTNSGSHVYNEKSFVIITGEEALQIGLIVDRVNSMHMIPQAKIIWNAESKIGDAAEFLNAIVDLDDKVCGLVSVEAIKQKILSEF